MRHECACGEACCLALLFPSLKDVRVTQVARQDDDSVLITVRDAAEQAVCRSCHAPAARRHGSYRRRVHHDAVEGNPVVIEIEVTRFRCDNPGCGLGTFTMQVPGLAPRRARRSLALTATLQLVARATGGRPGARIAAQLGIGATASPRSLIRLLRALPQAGPAHVRHLGVDDFATRRGRTYGTVLVDLDSNTVIDLLNDRESATLAAWLRHHPEVEVICRDRAGAYADGAATGAPEAIQVADRFHLWKNLIDYVDKTVARHRADLAEPRHDHEGSDPPQNMSSASAAAAEAAIQERREDGRIVPRTRERHRAVHERLALGHSHSQIARDLGINRATVRKFARAADPEELLVRSAPGTRPSPLDGYTDHLHRRWDQGCRNAARLTEEIKTRGYDGSPQTVRRYLHTFRAHGTTIPTTPAAPSTRQVTQWICTHPDRLDPNDQAKLQAILARSAPLAATAAHVGAFADMLTGRTGTRDKLTAWMTAVDADDLPHLHSFTNGLRRDLDAVVNGLTLHHNSGPVEGIVNKIKTIKRQMFGRANLDLLRVRVLHAI
jgi:transposase